MKQLLALLAFLMASAFAFGQGANTLTIAFPGVPTGGCSFVMQAIDTANGVQYNCPSGSWSPINPTGGGTGTVTSVASGAGLTGGPVTVSGTLSIATGGVTNAMLANPATTVNSQSCTLGSTCTIPFQTNTVNNTSQAGINLLTSTANSVGLTVTPSNSGTNQEKFEITGGAYTGTAANLSGTPALPNGTTGTTQTVGDNTAKLATDAFVLANAGGGPPLGTVAQIPVMNAGATAYAPVTISGDSSITSLGVMTNTKINGIAVTGTPSTGYVPTATSSSAATWQAVNGVLPSGTRGNPLINTSGSTAYATSPLYVDASEFTGTSVCDKIDAALNTFYWVDARAITAANGFTMTCGGGYNWLRHCGGNVPSHLLLPEDTILTDVTVQQPKACIVEGAGRGLTTTIIKPAAALHTIAETNTKFALASGKLTWVTGSPGTVTATFPASTVFPFNANASTATTTVSGLGTATKSLVKTVTDGSTATDCTVGSGANTVLCIGNGSVWTFAPNVPDGQPVQVGCATAGTPAPDAAFNGIWRAYSAAGSGTATPTITYRAGNGSGGPPASSSGVCTVIFTTPLWLQGDYFQTNNYQGIRLEHLNLDADDTCASLSGGVCTGASHYGIVPLEGQNPQERSLVNDVSILDWNAVGIVGFGNEQNWGPIQNIESYMINANATGNCNPTGANLNGGVSGGLTIRAGVLPSEHVYLVDNSPKGIFFMTGTNGQGFSGANCQGSVGTGTTAPAAIIAGFDVSTPSITLLEADHTEASDIGIELGKQYSGSSSGTFSITVIDYNGSPSQDSDTTAVDISPLWPLNSDFKLINIRKNLGMTNTVVNGITAHTFTDSNIADYEFDKNSTLISECGSFTQFPCRQDGGFVSAGLFQTAASTTSSAGINLPHGSAPTSPVNGDLWSTTAGFFGRVNGSTVGPFGTGSGAVSSVSNSDGTLTISPTTGAVVGSLALGHANTWTALQTFGTNISIGGVTPTGATGTGKLVFDTAPTFSSTVNAVTGYEVNGAAPSGHTLLGNGTNYVDASPGIAGRAITGTTATDTIVTADCNPKRIEYVGSVAVAITLPTATTLGPATCVFKLVNNLSTVNDLTVTTTTWTCNGSATCVIHNGQQAYFWVDPNSSTNWVADIGEQGLTAGSNITFTRSALGLSVAASGGGGDTITSPNSTLSVGGTSSNTTLDLVGSAGEIMAGATPALTYTPTLGKSGTAGTLSLFPASGNFTTTLGSAATASNTVLFPATVPTTLHSVYCVTASTTCTLTDTGYAYNAIPNADLANSSLTIAVTSPITGGGSTALGATSTAIACATCVTSATSLTNNALMTGAGSQASQTVTTGTGVLTALGVNTGSAGAFVVNGGVLGTPSSGVITSLTGTCGSCVASNIPASTTLTTPNIGAATGTSLAATGGVSSQTKDLCADSSGSGTAQSCTSTPATFTVATGSCVTYTTTTTNSGTGLTTNINSLGAKSIAIPGASGFTTTLTASIIPANKPQLLCYDGTNWDDMQTGTASGGGGVTSFTGDGVIINNTGSTGGVTDTLTNAPVGAILVGPAPTHGAAAAAPAYATQQSNASGILPYYIADPVNTLFEYDNFIGGQTACDGSNSANPGKGYMNCNSTGGTLSYVDGVGLQAALAALSADNVQITTRQNFVNLATQTFDYKCRVNIDNITNVVFYAGFVQSGNARQSGIRFSTALSDTNWMFVTDNGTVNAVSSGVAPVGGTSVDFRIRSTTAGTLLFSINGGAETSVTTDVPNALNATWFYLDTTTTQAHNMQIAYWSIVVNNLIR